MLDAIAITGVANSILAKFALIKIPQRNLSLRGLVSPVLTCRQSP